jgi:hypothetical protein
MKKRVELLGLLYMACSLSFVSCKGEARTWWPMQVGMEWNYQSRDRDGTLDDAYSDLWRVTECGTHAGKSACHVVRDDIGPHGTYNLFDGWISVTDEGSRAAYYDGDSDNAAGWYTQERGPISDGAQFSTDEIQGHAIAGTWFSVGDVEVEAGIFDGCYRIEWEKSDQGNGMWEQQSDFICPGVGWVKTTFASNDTTSYTLPKELVRYSTGQK